MEMPWYDQRIMNRDYFKILEGIYIMVKTILLSVVSRNFFFLILQGNRKQNTFYLFIYLLFYKPCLGRILQKWDFFDGSLVKFTHEKGIYKIT